MNLLRCEAVIEMVVFLVIGFAGLSVSLVSILNFLNVDFFIFAFNHRFSYLVQVLQESRGNYEIKICDYSNVIISRIKEHFNLSVNGRILVDFFSPSSLV